MQRHSTGASGDGRDPADLLAVVPTPIFALDAEGRFSYVNDALVSRSGFARDRLLGRDLSVFLTAASVERCTDAIRSLLESGVRSRTVSVEAETARGSLVRATVRLALLPLEGGYRGTVGVVTRLEDAGARA